MSSKTHSATEHKPTHAAAPAASTPPIMKITPLADRAVVQPLEAGTEMRGGLYIPDTAKEKPQQGKIVAVGPGRYEKDKRIPMEVKVGDTVLYGKYSGAELTVGGEPVFILREADILAIIG